MAAVPVPDPLECLEEFGGTLAVGLPEAPTKAEEAPPDDGWGWSSDGGCVLNRISLRTEPSPLMTVRVILMVFPLPVV